MFQGLIIDRLFAKLHETGTVILNWTVIQKKPLRREIHGLVNWSGSVNKLQRFGVFTAFQVGQCPEEFGVIYIIIYNAVGCCWNEIEWNRPICKVETSHIWLFCSHSCHWPLGQIQGETSCRLPTCNLIASLHCFHWLRHRRLAARWIQQPWLALHFFAALPLKWHAITMRHPPWKEPQNWHLTKDGCEVAPGSLVIDAPSSSYFFLTKFNCCEASSDETHMKDAEESQAEAQNEQQSFSSTHPYLDSQWASAIHVAHNGPCHCPKHKLA